MMLVSALRRFNPRGSLRYSSTVTSIPTPLPYKKLSHAGAEINLDTIGIKEVAEFNEKLTATVQAMRESQQVASVYLKASFQSSHLLAGVGALGFKYHRAEDETSTLLLWLPDRECKVPPFATHHVGVGAVVLDGSGNILVVKDKHRHSAVGWKLPGGYVNVGEEISDGAIREVREETGVKCEFVDVVSFRHSHDALYGKGDLYFITRLRALTTEIVIDDEIEEAKWVNLHEFYSTLKHPLLSTALERVIASPQAKYMIEVEGTSVIPNKPPYKVYLSQK